MRTEEEWKSQAAKIWIASMELERREGLLPPELCAMWRFARSMTAERSEDLARAFDRLALEEAKRADELQRESRPIAVHCGAANAYRISAELARSPDIVCPAISKPEAPGPKTREQVLEEALRGLLADPVGGKSNEAARRALEWKPEGNAK